MSVPTTDYRDLTNKLTKLRAQHLAVQTQKESLENQISSLENKLVTQVGPNWRERFEADKKVVEEWESTH